MVSDWPVPGSDCCSSCSRILWTGGASLSLIGALTAVATAAGTMIAFSLLSKYVFSKLGSWASILATVVAVVAAVYGGYLAYTGTTGQNRCPAP